MYSVHIVVDAWHATGEDPWLEKKILTWVFFSWRNLGDPPRAGLIHLEISVLIWPCVSQIPEESNQNSNACICVYSPQHRGRMWCEESNRIPTHAGVSSSRKWCFRKLENCDSSWPVVSVSFSLLNGPIKGSILDVCVYVYVRTCVWKNVCALIAVLPD